MIDIEKLKLLIVERLKPLDPEKIILFGSYAYGTPNEDSDIDLYIVTNDDFIPLSFKEDSQIYLKISKQLRDIITQYPTDLVVHTKKMYQKAIDINQLFVKNIIQNGVKLYG